MTSTGSNFQCWNNATELILYNLTTRIAPNFSRYRKFQCLVTSPVGENLTHFVWISGDTFLELMSPRINHNMMVIKHQVIWTAGILTCLAKVKINVKRCLFNPFHLYKRFHLYKPWQALGKKDKTRINHGVATLQYTIQKGEYSFFNYASFMIYL